MWLAKSDDDLECFYQTSPQLDESFDGIDDVTCRPGQVCFKKDHGGRYFLILDSSINIKVKHFHFIGQGFTRGCMENKGPDCGEKNSNFNCYYCNTDECNSGITHQIGFLAISAIIMPFIARMAY